MNKGFSTLIVVIIVGAIVTSLTVYVVSVSIWSLMGSINDKNSMQADQIANACAEIALEAMRENNLFVGTNNATINNSSCNYTVTNNGASNRTILVTGAVGNITRKIKIITNNFNPITVSSWQNVGDF